MLLDSQPPSKATGPSLLTLSCLSPSLTGLGVSSPIPQLLQEAFLGTSIPGLGLGRRPPGEARASARSQAGEKRGDRAELGVRVLRSRAGKGALQADGISPVCRPLPSSHWPPSSPLQTVTTGDGALPGPQQWERHREGTWGRESLCPHTSTVHSVECHSAAAPPP